MISLSETKHRVFCGCPASEEAKEKMVKIGFFTTSKGKRQRLKCQFCGRTETIYEPDDLIQISVKQKVADKLLEYGAGIESNWTGDGKPIWSEILSSMYDSLFETMEEVEAVRSELRELKKVVETLSI